MSLWKERVFFFNLTSICIRKIIEWTWKYTYCLRACEVLRGNQLIWRSKNFTKLIKHSPKKILKHLYTYVYVRMGEVAFIHASQITKPPGFWNICACYLFYLFQFEDRLFKMLLLGLEILQGRTQLRLHLNVQFDILNELRVQEQCLFSECRSGGRG